MELVKWIYLTLTELFRYLQRHAWTSSPKYPTSASIPTHPGISSVFLQPPTPAICISFCFPSSPHGPPHPCWKPSSPGRWFVHPNPVGLCSSQFPLIVSTLSALTITCQVSSPGLHHPTAFLPCLQSHPALHTVS